MWSIVAGRKQNATSNASNCAMVQASGPGEDWGALQPGLDVGGTVALSGIDADPASGGALDGCRNPVFRVSTVHFSTRSWVLSVLRIGRRGLTQQCPA